MGRRIELWSVALLVLLVGGVRLWSYHQPLEMDGATYAVIASELRSGRSLYGDLWDHKPPAIYAIYAAAQILLGDGPAHTFALGWLTASLTLLAIHAAARRATGSGGAAILAAAFWAVVSADPLLRANQPNSEVFLNLLHATGFALLLGLGARASLARVAAIGSAFALASLFKHVSVAVAAALCAAHFVAPPPGRSRARTVGDAVVVAAIGAGVWLATFGYFAAVGRLADAWDAIVTFNRAYAGEPVSALLALRQPSRLFPSESLAVLPLLVALAWGCAATRVRVGREGWLWLALMLGTAVAIVLPGKFHVHYYQLWLPGLCLGAAYAITRSPRPSLRGASWAVGASVLATLVAWQVAYLRSSPEAWTRTRAGERLAGNQRLAQAIDGWLEPGETFFQWGHHAELYYYAGRRPPTGELRAGHLFHGTRMRERGERARAALEAARPALVVTTGSWTLAPPGHPVVGWIRAHYEEWKPEAEAVTWPAGPRFYVRRDDPPRFAAARSVAARPAAARPEARALPHVILLSMDTTRRDHVTFYGYEKPTTPRLAEHVAERGVVFDSAIAVHTNTAPSHASMLTGVHPGVHGILRNGMPLSTEIPVLAERLRAEGYATGAFVSGWTLTRHTGLERGFERYDDRLFGKTRRAEETLAAAAEWVEGTLAAGERIFLFFHLFDPHFPYRPRESDALRFLPQGRTAFSAPLDARISRLKSENHMSERVAEEYVARYDAEIAHADAAMGRLLDLFERPGVADETLVLFVSDHGETLFERDWVFDHGGRAYDEQIRVPLAIRLPGGAGAGKRVEAQVSHVDLLPTIFDVLGLAIPDHVEGRSLLPLLEEHADAEPRPVFAHARPVPRRVPHIPAPLEEEGLVSAIRLPGFKLIEYPAAHGGWYLEVFDLANDPGERTNLAGASPGSGGVLRAELARFRDRTLGDARKPPPRLAREVEDALRSLGYVE